jgi:hypothetical protein
MIEYKVSKTKKGLRKTITLKNHLYFLTIRS